MFKMKRGMKMKPPIPWFGGKQNMAKILLSLMPEHHIYCEVFGGAASLLHAKTPAPVEVYNDMNSGLVNLFRVIREPQTYEEFRRLVALTPYSREERKYAFETWKTENDPVKKAWAFYVAVAQGFSGNIEESSWSFSVSHSTNHMASAVSAWLNAIERLPEIHVRWQTVQIEHDDFRKVIPRYDTENTLFYLDPPYVQETRKGGKYTHEMTIADHEELATLLLKMKGMALLSGYYHDVYKPLEQMGWKQQNVNQTCWAVGRTRHTKIQGPGPGMARKEHRRTECIWISPAIQQRIGQMALW